MKRVSFILTLLLLCTFVSYGPAGEVRKWTAGSHSVEGEFVELLENGSIVRIRKTDGKFTRVPLAKLSEKDQEYVKEAENTGTTLPASSKKAGERKILTVDGVKYAFRWCPPGEFMMGAPESEWPDRPSFFYYNETPHKVKLTKGFWLLETEVTQAMWESMMGENPSYFKGEKNPVERVSWEKCQEFCKKLSLKLGQRVRLPTEAQWEYACRAGTTTAFCWGGDEGLLYQYGNYCDQSNTDDFPRQDKAHDDGNDKTAPVGSYKPNAWGLYDMHGNVWEWCSDYYDVEYYNRSSASDPENTTESSGRVVRGGSWCNYAEFCRSAFRTGGTPIRDGILGFRVLLVPSQE